MDKRFQVFVSSTFLDLIDERRAVMQALLELNCIPAGMELFPASSDEQWTVIQRVIDDCDYYLVILAARYGSVDSQGMSYTEREYDYAVQAGKPVLGFVHKTPGEIAAKFTERDPAIAAKLEAFREKVQHRLCKYWTTADELGGVVSRSYVQLLKTHPAEGWVKSRYAKTTEDLEKVNSMHEQIRVLEEELAGLRQVVPGNIQGLARGEDRVQLTYSRASSRVSKGGSGSIAVSWNQVFSCVGRACIDLPREGQVRGRINDWVREIAAEPEAIEVNEFDRIKIQFYSLGLIKTEILLRMTNPHDTRPQPQPTLCWVLTEAGRNSLADLLAEKRLSQSA